ncbi:hypothetical protein SBC2_09920 [Caballeronia sp. SBC2]|nr:hypothetical protein SBC2_09920 [Caballeronia sp. SBC2]
MAPNGALDEAILAIFQDPHSAEPYMTTLEITRRFKKAGHEDLYPKKVQRHLSKLESDDMYVV